MPSGGSELRVQCARWFGQFPDSREIRGRDPESSALQVCGHNRFSLYYLGRRQEQLLNVANTSHVSGLAEKDGPAAM